MTVASKSDRDRIRQKVAERRRDEWKRKVEERIAIKRAEKAELAAAIASVPLDARSLTARLMGDPLPGRSALDQAQR